MTRLLLLALALLVAACSSEPDDPRLDPVFVVMCADIDPGEPPHPCCTGFALRGQVVTANHCVPGEYSTLVNRRQWLTTASDSDVGHVVARDEALDIAWLDARVEAQLDRGPTIMNGADVSVLTVSGVKPGTAHTRAGDFWLSDADTKFGDSGAAVVDAHGDAIGVLSRCTTHDEKQCDPSTGIFAELP